MDANIVSAVIGGAAGLGTGVIGSLLAPWSMWGVEKRRQQFQRRHALIDEWRRGIAEHLRSGDADGTLPRQAWYSATLAKHVDRQVAKDRLGWRRNLPPFARRRMRPKKDTTLRRHPLPTTPPVGRTLMISVDGVDADYLASVVNLAVEKLARRWRVD